MELAWAAISPSSKFHRESCDRVREPIRIFIDSIPPPPPEICDEICEEGEIKEPEAPQEMKNKTPDHRGRRRRRTWARKVISGGGDFLTNAVMGSISADFEQADRPSPV